MAALGLGTIEECTDFDDVFDDFPGVGLDRSAQKALFRAWVRLHLERKSFRPEGAEIRDWEKAGPLPKGLMQRKMSQVLPGRFEDYLQRVLSGDQNATGVVSDWFQRLVRNSALLDFENDLYYLRPLGLALKLRLEDGWLRCVDCGRIHPESLADACPGCLGKLVEADPDYLDARTGFTATRFVVRSIQFSLSRLGYLQPSIQLSSPEIQRTAHSTASKNTSCVSRTSPIQRASFRSTS